MPERNLIRSTRNHSNSLANRISAVTIQLNQMSTLWSTNTLISPLPRLNHIAGTRTRPTGLGYVAQRIGGQDYRFEAAIDQQIGVQRL